MQFNIRMSTALLLIALLLPIGLVSAEEATVSVEPDTDTYTLEQGLDRDRAAYRAETLERRRLEEEERRKGAGLDRERSEQRAKKMAESRGQQQYN